MSITDSINSLTSALGGNQLGLKDQPFFKDLQTASWRGIPFAVVRSSHSSGRKNVVHQYPYVDGVYVEDLGQGAKTYRIQGFFLEGGGAYGSGTLKSQIDAMDRAVSQPGDAVLVHPILGSMSKIALMSYECETGLDKGRVAEIRFTFIDNSAKKTPSVAIDTRAQVRIAAAQSLLAQLLDFEGAVHNLVRTSVAVVLNTVNQFTTLVRGITFTATSLVTMISALPGNLGRMVGQAFPASQINKKATTATLIGAASASQTSVLSTMTTMHSVAASGNVSGIGSGVQSVVSAVLVANPDPAQAIQSMIAIIAGSPSASINSVSNATTDLMRRTAAANMAIASANYNPVSYQDAESIRTIVCGALQAEMDIAGDQGLDATYNSLRALKTAVSQDLTRRGASLLSMITVTSQTPVSSLVWAQKLYQDSAREPEIVNEGNPIHPAFMPIKFQVLAA